MEIELTGRKVEITSALKALTIEKLEKIKRHALPITRIHVIFSVENHTRQSVEANVHLSGIDINARAEKPDMYKALDEMIHKLDTQVRKHKAKITDHR